MSAMLGQWLNAFMNYRIRVGVGYALDISVRVAVDSSNLLDDFPEAVAVLKARKGVPASLFVTRQVRSCHGAAKAIKGAQFVFDDDAYTALRRSTVFAWRAGPFWIIWQRLSTIAARHFTG